MNNNGIELKIDNKQIKAALNGFGEAFHASKIKALKAGAMVLKKAAQQGFDSSGISNAPNELYSDLIRDGIMMSKADEVEDKVKVHIMGTKNKKSGTFRLRFFENGTKDRYQTEVNGKALKKKRFVGKIPDGKYSFFNTAVDGASSNATSTFESVLFAMIDKAWNNT